MNKVLTFFAFAISFLPLTPSIVNAVEIDPMRLEYSLQAGKEYSGSFKLTNPTTSQVEVSLSTGEYRYIFSPGIIQPSDASKKRVPSSQDWVEFKQGKVTLGPGQSRNADFIIKVPKETKDEHLCAVIFDEKSNLNQSHESGNVQIKITPRFSIPVYISIKDSENVSAEIEDLSVISVEKTRGIQFVLTVENTGNKHLRPFGTLVVLNKNNGDLVRNLSIGKTLPLFPGYKEVISIPCPDLPSGKYTAVVTLELDEDIIVQKKAAFKFKKGGKI